MDTAAIPHLFILQSLLRSASLCFGVTSSFLLRSASFLLRSASSCSASESLLTASFCQGIRIIIMGVFTNSLAAVSSSSSDDNAASMSSHHVLVGIRASLFRTIKKGKAASASSLSSSSASSSSASSTLAARVYASSSSPSDQQKAHIKKDAQNALSLYLASVTSIITEDSQVEERTQAAEAVFKAFNEYAGELTPDTLRAAGGSSRAARQSCEMLLSALFDAVGTLPTTNEAAEVLKAWRDVREWQGKLGAKVGHIAADNGDDGDDDLRDFVAPNYAYADSDDDDDDNDDTRSTTTTQQTRASSTDVDTNDAPAGTLPWLHAQCTSIASASADRLCADVLTTLATSDSTNEHVERAAAQLIEAGGDAVVPLALELGAHAERLLVDVTERVAVYMYAENAAAARKQQRESTRCANRGHCVGGTAQGAKGCKARGGAGRQAHVCVKRRRRCSLQRFRGCVLAAGAGGGWGWRRRITLPATGGGACKRGTRRGAPQAPPSHLNALRQTSRLASNLPNKRECRSLVRILCGARSGSSRRYRRRRHHHEVGDVHLRMGRGPTMRPANLFTAAVGVHSVVGSCQQLPN